MVDANLRAEEIRSSLKGLGLLAVGVTVAAGFFWIILGRYEPPISTLFNWIGVAFSGVWLLTMAVGGVRRNGSPKQQRGTTAWWAAIANTAAVGMMCAVTCLPRAITFALDGDWARSAVAATLGIGMATWMALSIRRFVREDESPA